MSPFDAWLLLRSLRTLELRVVKHSENALALAEFLQEQPQVSKVYYPGLKSSESHEIAKKQFVNELYGGMVSIDLVGGEKAAYEFIRALKNIKFLPSLASYTTSISYPGKTSHRALTEEERDAAGISMGLVRLSIGLESIEDLKKEFKKALSSI
jgi:methionine-gamma-lyase